MAPSCGMNGWGTLLPPAPNRSQADWSGCSLPDCSIGMQQHAARRCISGMSGRAPAAGCRMLPSPAAGASRPTSRLHAHMLPPMSPAARLLPTLLLLELPYAGQGPRFLGSAAAACRRRPAAAPGLQAEPHISHICRCHAAKAAGSRLPCVSPSAGRIDLAQTRSLSPASPPACTGGCWGGQIGARRGPPCRGSRCERPRRLRGWVNAGARSGRGTPTIIMSDRASQRRRRSPAGWAERLAQACILPLFSFSPGSKTRRATEPRAIEAPQGPDGAQLIDTAAAAGTLRQRCCPSTARRRQPAQGCHHCVD